jgi:hypothetical protein
MSGLFSNEAARYWAHAVSVIPLQTRSKRPAAGITNWTGYCDNLPRQETRDQWLRTHGSAGIGLCLGTLIGGDRIGAVDVDDERFVRVTIALLGKCPSAKRGKKGLTIFVRVPKTATIRSTTLKSADKRGAIDILLSGRMTVLPPSIHQDTGRPYQWVGQPLFETAFEDLPVLDEGKLALLKLIVGSDAAATIATGETTHDAGLTFAASLVRASCEDGAIARIFMALLPVDYSGNSLDELPEWIRSAREKGFGDHGRAPGRKQSAAEVIIAATDKAGIELFHDVGNRAYLSLPSAGGIRHVAIRSSEATLRISHLYYSGTGKAPSSRTVDEALNVLEAPRTPRMV